MVSPCKKKKVDKKGRATNEPSPPRNSLGSRRLKSSKPLSHKKFYLDIKNNASLRNVEAKLTSLGARLELFLVKDVDCVVTDRDDYPQNNSRQQFGLVTPSPFSVSVSPATTATDSPTDGLISKRTRSRAEAMLEKARQQPQRNSTIDILDNAVAWKIPILSLTKVWIEKIVRKRSSQPGVRELRGHFLKIETGTGRPDFKQFKSWPKVSFSDHEPAAFPLPKPLSRHDPQRMTKKVGKTGKDSSTVPGGGNGYCEICRVHYDQLDAHVSSTQHSKLVSDPAQYSHLDSLISHHDLGNVSLLRKSLRIAKSPPAEMGTKHSMEAPTSTTMNGHITRSKSDKILHNGLSPIEKKKKETKGCNSSDVIRLERSYDVREKDKGKEREKEREKDKGKEKDKSKEKEKCKEKEHEKVKEREKDKGRDRERAKGKETERESERHRGKEVETFRELEKDSSDERERPESDHNLRSRHSSKPVTPQAKRIRPSRKRLSVEEKLIEDNKSYYKVEVLNSKLRSTEYFISQQQAEEARVNGGLEENGCAEKEDVKEPVVVRFRKVRKSQLALLNDEADKFMFPRLDSKPADSDSSDDSSADSLTSEEELSLRKRRTISRSSDKKEIEAFSPRSKNHSSALVTTQSFDDENSDDEPLMTLNDITFTFENPPKKEPWMEGYKSEEKSYYFPHYHEYPSVLLPYEYPPSERMKLLSGKRSAPGCIRRRTERFSRLMEDGKPRKSPRCHASTLAIMSSLMRRRPIRECTTNPDFTYEEESRSSLPETVDTSSSASDGRLGLYQEQGPSLPVDPTGDSYAIALARLYCGETSTFQVTPGPCLPVDPAILTDPPPGIESSPGLDIPLITLLDQPPLPLHRLFDIDFKFLDVDSGSDCSDLIGFGEDGRGVSGKRRKRKRNLTGWPVEKHRKRVVRKEGDPLVKCETCEIKLEPIGPEVLGELSFKDEPGFGDDSLNLPVIPIKRGRGRPRKYPMIIPPTSFSPQLSPKSSPKKKSVPRFTFSPRRSCLK